MEIYKISLKLIGVSLLEKIIVITGGSDGLGKTIALRLAENKNNKVIILAKNEEKLMNIAVEANLDYQLCDVKDYTSVETAVQVVLRRVVRWRLY